MTAQRPLARPSANARGRRVARGVAALGLLLVALIVVPVVAWKMLGSPIPHTAPSTGSVRHDLLGRDDGSIFLAAIRVVFWLAWLTFAASTLLDIVAQLRRVPTMSIRGLGWVQGASGPLVASVALMFTGAPAMASTTHALPPPPATAMVAAADVTTAAAAAQTPVSRGAPTYTVLPGDSLWGIAGTHLPATAACPDPHMRWEEIWSANRGTVQDDGEQMTSPDVIQPGWRLTLPADAFNVPGSLAPPTTTTPPHRGAAVVPPGPQSTPPATRVPSLRPPVTTAPQQLAPPASGGLHTPAVAPSASAVTPSAPANPPAQSALSTPAPAATPPAPPAAAPARSSNAAQLPLELTGGGLLAAGLLWMLRRRRLRRQLAAGLGDLPPLPSPAAAAAEVAATVGADLDGAEFLHLALLAVAAAAERAAVPLPDLVQAQLDSQQLELTFTGPPALLAPAPYRRAAATRWQLARDTDRVTLDPTGTLRDLVAPYPGLTLLGHTAADPGSWTADQPGHVGEDGVSRTALLVDLEHVRSVAVAGRDDQVADVLRFAGIGLATSGWATDLQLTAVDVDEVLETAGPDRVRVTDDLDGALADLEAKTASQQARTERGGPSLLADRATGEGTTTHLLLLGRRSADPDTRDRLARLARPGQRCGVGIIAPEALLPEPGLTVRVDDAGWLHLPGAPSPVAGTLSAATASAVGEALRVADAPAVPPRRPRVDVDLATGVAHVRPVPGPSPAVLRSPAETPPQLATAEPTASPPVVVPVIRPPRTPEPAAPAVLIRLMGTVSVEGPGRVPSSQSHTRIATEILAYLAVHGPTMREDLLEAVWPPGRVAAGRALPQPAPKTVFAHISRARALAGTDPDGRPFLAEAERGEPLTLSRAVRTDWQLFESLRDAVWDRAGDDLVDGLQRALDLVRGGLPRPETRNGGESGWLWLSTSPMWHHLPAAAKEAAVRLAEAYLHRGDNDRARDTVVKLLDAGVEEWMFDEGLWRLRILADFRGRGDEQAYATVALLQAMLAYRARWTDDEDQGQMGPELAEFLSQLLDPAAAS